MASAAPDHRRPLRRVEYDLFVSLGTFDGERVELVNGELRRMSPIRALLNSTVDQLTPSAGCPTTGSSTSSTILR